MTLLALVALLTSGAFLTSGALAAMSPQSPEPPEARPKRAVVVASKPFGESYLLAELFAQLLESRGIAVERRPGLGATELAFSALRTGAIDVYPEYTGTGLLAILGAPPRPDPQEVFALVSREFHDRFGLRWLPPLGFENTYAIAVRRETADRLKFRTLSDLARASGGLRAGFTADFIGRPDGLAGLRGAYGFKFAEVRALGPAIKYQALEQRAVDVIDGYSTDGLLADGQLVVLRDDRGFFPPYQAAALVGAQLQRERPEAVAALTELSGRLDVEQMRRLNRRVELEHEPVAAVAAAALGDLGLVGRGARPASAHAAGERADDGMLAYVWRQRGALLGLTARHLLLVAASLLAAIAVAVPLGLALERTRRGAEATVRAAGLLQAVPSIALLAFMLPLLGVGVVPALAALFLYALYPILRNTYTGVREASPEAVRAARALGMTDPQILRHVRLPLAAPTIMAGIRTAAVIDVGTATLAAFIGAGGLGEPIVSGLALADTRMILSGAIPAALLALAVDGVLGLCERALRPHT